MSLVIMFQRQPHTSVNDAIPEAPEQPRKHLKE